MVLSELWDKYAPETEFNVSSLPEELKQKGKMVTFAARQMMVIHGESLKYIFFIISGHAIGQRSYMDGKELNYFSVDSTSGNIGLLELIARTDRIVATIVTLTEVTALQIDAALVYGYIMSDISLLRRCASLVARDLYSSSDKGGLFYYVKGIDRVRYYLAEAFGKNKQDLLTLEFQYQDIANATGLSVRTVGRSIQQMKEKGELKPEYRKLEIGKVEYHKILDALCESSMDRDRVLAEIDE